MNLGNIFTMLNPQNISVEDFKKKSQEEQAEIIASICNSRGISKEKLLELMKYIKTIKKV